MSRVFSSSGTIKPLKVLHHQEVEFYEKVYVMVPICAAVVFLFSVLVAVFLFCRRRKDRLRYKGNIVPKTLAVLVKL